MKKIKQFILLIIVIVLVLSLCACYASEREDTGGDTDIGGLFWDILHGIEGDGTVTEVQSAAVCSRNDSYGEK